MAQFLKQQKMWRHNKENTGTVRQANVLISCPTLCNPPWGYKEEPARLLCPRDSPCKSTGVGSHSLLQGIFVIQGSKCIESGFFTIWATREAPIISVYIYIINMGFSVYAHVSLNWNGFWQHPFITVGQQSWMQRIFFNQIISNSLCIFHSSWILATLK